MTNPVSGKIETRIILFEDDSARKQVIVLCIEEKQRAFQFFFHPAKGESARKMKKRMNNIFTGFSERAVQSCINKSKKIKGRFDKKRPLHPVHSNKTWSQVQIDLMSIADNPVSVVGKVYK